MRRWTPFRPHVFGSENVEEVSGSKVRFDGSSEGESARGSGGRTFLTSIGVLLLSAFVSLGGSAVENSNTPNNRESALADWWNGKYGTGKWFGVRNALSDRGLKLEGRWRNAYYGVIASQNGSRGFFDQEFAFGALVNFDELTGSDALDGLVGFVETRWRDPASADDPNTVVQASNMFNPSPYESGVGWRFVQFGLRYSTPELFGVKDAVTLTGGWLRPCKEFLVQPLSMNFLNTAIQLAKGLGGNTPFSSNFSTWGGVLEVKPVKWQYTKAGLFMSYPQATLSSNNGLMMQGYAPDTSQNGLYFIGETGVTPELGSDRLPGKYAFGGYFYGEHWRGSGGDKYGFYWQADQMLYRETAKDTPSGASREGLYIFSMATFAPPYNNRYPFYAQAGLSYEGLLPKRHRDLTLLASGLGKYANQSGKTYTSVIEGGYRVQLTDWAFFQPSVQYLIRPNGSSNVKNAAILGFFAGVNF